MTVEGLERCVHCGLCLPSCPTYRVLGDENDSPRGRLHLMRARRERPEEAADAFALHIDRCLGCRACEVACPAGVPYGSLLEEARADLAEERAGGSRMAAAALAALAGDGAGSRILYAGLRAFRSAGIARAAGGLPGRAGTAARLLDATRPAVPPAPGRRSSPAAGSASGATYALLEGCVMGGLFGHVHAATRRALEARGLRERPAPGVGCCGALYAHAGLPGPARELARRNVAGFERSGADLLVSNSAGCGAALHEYGSWLADEPAWAERARSLGERVRDVMEVLADAAEAPGAAGDDTEAAGHDGRADGEDRPPSPSAPPAGGRPLRVAYDAPCHSLYAQRIEDAPLAALRGALDRKRVEVEPLPSSAECCGGAGTYNLLEPELSRRVLAPKLEEIRAGGYDVVVTGNPGCIMQIRAGLAATGSPVPVLHPVELLAPAEPREARA